MDQKKIGQFIKELRKEKGITQEQLAERLNVSGRSVSRWETGSNMPDISLLVEIADSFDVDVRELIEGERKSEMMDEEVREVATKMADYADAEKGKLLKKIQIISFAGLILTVLLIIWQSTYFDLESYDNRFSLFVSFSVLLVMAIITLYVTGVLEKLIKHRAIYKGIKIVTIVGLIIGFIKAFLIPIIIILFLVVPFSLTWPKVYTDIEKYNQYMSFEKDNADDRWNKFGMDETIWPQKITDNMKVEDYKMIYYNPWDAQYLGYLVVEYSDEDYAKEVQRLQNHRSTEYLGYYGVIGEQDYNLLAINADAYHGFIYALSDGKGKIIYAEELFCNYFMDLDYEKYIPKEYLLDGFDASPDNPYQEMVTNGNYHANDFAVTLYGLSAYNKSELISQNGADFNSNFEMFPDSIKEFADGQYVSKMNLDTDDSFEYTILRIKYSEDDYNAELERLSNMGDAKSEVGSGNLIYDDKSYNYPAYIAKDGEDNVYEYVLNNENDREIIYVILSNPIVSEMKEWYEYLKIDRNSYEK